jgi:acetylornithine deacetylase
VRIERRTIPGETPDDVRAELEAACAAVTARRSSFAADVAVTFSQEPSDVAVDAPIVQALGDAIRATGDSVRVEGMTAWTDAALLNAAGIPAICFGPGDIGVAHAAEEWVAVDEIERATNVLAQLALRWCAGT